MDPNQSPQQPLQNPYDFLNAGAAQKKTPFGFGSGPKNKTVITVIFLVVVAVVLIAGFAIFGALTKKDYTAYTTLLNKQTEIIRISTSGIDKGRTTSVRNYAATVSAMTQSEKVQTLDTVKKLGQKVDEKILNAKKDANNDKRLASAEQANQFDDTFTELLNTLIADYQKSIVLANKTAETKSEKALMALLLANAKVLVNAPKTE